MPAPSWPGEPEGWSHDPSPGPPRPRRAGPRSGPLAAVVGVAVVVAAASAVGGLLTRTPAPPPVRAAAAAAPDPRARDGGVMAYDPATQSVMLYGGLVFGGTGESALDDTWSWSGSRWTELDPGSSPPPLAGALMGYDPATRRLVLTGGYGTSSGGTIYPVPGTWTWDGSTWSADPTADIPSSDGMAALATDDATGQLILVTAQPDCRGFQTFRWSSGGWAALAPAVPPAPGGSPGLGYDPDIGALILVTDTTGCPTGTATTPTASTAASAGGDSSAWSWDGSNWAPERSAAPPAASGEVLNWFDGPLLVTPAHTYAWAGGDWAQVGPGPGVAEPAAAWDQADGQVVLFSGFCASCSGTDLSEATWTWPGTTGTWKLRAGAPPTAG